MSHGLFEEGLYSLMESTLLPGAQGEAGIRAAAASENWRARYAAARAIEARRDPALLPVLEALLAREDTRPLYTQKPVERFENSLDDTRMAEHLRPIRVVFDREYDEETLEAWKCRGRIRQACLIAAAVVGSPTEGLIRLAVRAIADPGEDYNVKAASCRLLAATGDARYIPDIAKGLAYDEWCTQTEAAKAIRRLGGEAAMP